MNLSDKTGKVVSTNFYWLPKKTSVFDWSLEHEREHPYYSGVTRSEDLSLLSQLPKVRLEASAAVARRPANRQLEGEDVRVQIHNPSKNLALQIHLAIVDEKSGDEILPVLWGDNYVSLMPGETRAVIAHYDSRPGPLRLDVNGWNIEAKNTPVKGTATKLNQMD